MNLKKILNRLALSQTSQTTIKKSMGACCIHVLDRMQCVQIGEWVCTSVHNGIWHGNGTVCKSPPHKPKGITCEPNENEE